MRKTIFSLYNLPVPAIVRLYVLLIVALIPLLVTGCKTLAGDIKSENDSVTNDKSVKAGKADEVQSSKAATTRPPLQQPVTEPTGPTPTPTPTGASGPLSLPASPIVNLAGSETHQHGQQNQKAAPQAGQQENQTPISLNFDDVDIYEIAHTVFKDILKVNYLIDPRVKGRVTFNTVKPLKISEVLPVVSTVFRLSGVGIIEENGIYRLLPLSEVNKEPSSVGFGRHAGDVSVSGFSRIQIVSLNFVGKKEMKDLLTPFLSTGATILEVPGQNCIIITDTDENLKRLLQIVEIFDDDIFTDMKVEMFVFKNLDIKDALEDLRTTFPMFTATTKESLKIKFLPIERLNALLVVAPHEEYLNHIRRWVEIIDKVFEGARPKVYVYPLQNAPAEHIVEILTQILSDSASPAAKSKPAEQPKTTDKSQTKTDQSTTTTTTDKAKLSAIKVSSSSFVSSDTRIFYDDTLNSLIILALPKDYHFIEGLIKQIDIIPRQVLIETLVVEVNLNDTLKYGVEWFLVNDFAISGDAYKGITSFGSKSDFSYDATNPLDSTGFTFATIDSEGMIRSLIQTLSTQSTVNILSSPKILVSDNHEAKIQVGNQVAIATSETNVTGTTNIQRTIQYKDTGVILTVKPQINDSGLVRLDITQEVSDVSTDTVAEGINSPTIITRNIKTNMSVKNGKSIILGGMIQDKKEKTTKGIPLLREIPILGNLFSVNTDTSKRTELLVIITPHVVKSIDEASAMTEEFKKKLTGLQDMLMDETISILPESSHTELPVTNVPAVAPALLTTPAATGAPSTNSPSTNASTTDAPTAK